MADSPDPRRIVIIQGSTSDTPYTDRIIGALVERGFTGDAGYTIERRIASAHRSPLHLQRILDQYGDDDVHTLFITVAGLSDALSGTAATRYSDRVVACPPDAGQFGAMKEFSSARTPSGATVHYTRTPEEAAMRVQSIFLSVDFSRSQEALKHVSAKAAEIMRADAQMQGAEFPQPYTFCVMGKTRELYDLGDGTLLITASDRVSAFDRVMDERIPGKGVALTELSEFWFRHTSMFPNHFLERVDDRSIRVTKAERVNVEWIVRGYLYGSLWRAYQKGERELYGLTLPDGLLLAQELPNPILTATTKASKGHDLPITKAEAIAQGLVRDEAEWDSLAQITFDLYHMYRHRGHGTGLIIPDFKIEFGRTPKGHIQIDEPPNHDSARLWAGTFYIVGRPQEGHALDKEFLRQFLLESGYRGDGDPPYLPELVVDQIARRVRGATAILTGRESKIENFGLLSVDDARRQLERQRDV